MPRKNLRTIDGRPLILHTLETLDDLGWTPVVSTEDPEIAAFARVRGYQVLDRPTELSDDDATLAEVAQHAVEEIEHRGWVGVFQCTAPLTTADDIDKAFKIVQGSSYDSLVTVTPGTHITWDTQTATPIVARENRQLLAERYATEAGAFFFATDEVVRSGRMVGDSPYFYDLAHSIDIDTPADFEAARVLKGRRWIHFRVGLGKRIGTGHLHRCLALADELSHHRITFSFSEEKSPWAVDLCRSRGIDVDRVAPFWPDLIVNDHLDCEREDVLSPKAAGVPVVCLEDLSVASNHADLVINELYRDDRPNVLSGPKYAVLRPEFLCPPEFTVRERPNRVLLSFGGTDPTHLTSRMVGALWNAGNLDCEVRAILGPGYEGPEPNCDVAEGPISMAQEFLDADLLICSAGRTVNEAAAIGIPTISIAANERETHHAHVDGVVRLGLHASVTDQQIRETVYRLLDHPDLRGDISNRMRSQVDGRGARRIAYEIQRILEGL